MISPELIAEALKQYQNMDMETESGWSLIRVVSHHCGLSSGWSLIIVASHQGGPSLGWFFIRVVSHHCGLSSGWSLIMVVSYQGDLSSVWSLVMMVSHQASLSSGVPLYDLPRTDRGSPREVPEHGHGDGIRADGGVRFQRVRHHHQPDGQRHYSLHPAAQPIPARPQREHPQQQFARRC